MLQVTCVTKLVWRGMAMHACNWKIKSDYVHATNKVVLQQTASHMMVEL